MKENYNEVDVLIIGSGIAGLTAAIKLAQAFPQHSVVVITKNSNESNTRYAQGGIAVVIDLLNDSLEKHIDDTLLAGGGACDKNVVEMVINEAQERLNEIIEWGAEFDRVATGELSLGLEGGHTAKRIVHVKDFTGLHLEIVLLRKAATLSNLKIASHRFALDLITAVSEEKSTGSDWRTKCLGAYVLNEESGLIESYVSKVTILATGGAGQVYRTTTNPAIATGDGVAMAHRAHARIKDMAFVQFHPTGFSSSGKGSSFLISEAVRGYGAHLVNAQVERFMFRYDVRGELAPRDIVSRAIEQEKKSNDHYIFLDCRHLDQADLKMKFPTIVEQCQINKLDPQQDLIPVEPAAHYFCGGIDVDLKGRSSIDKLYACGECACTGLHGANRLASNSLLEAMVYAHHCFIDISEKLSQLDFTEQKPQPFRVSDTDCSTTLNVKLLRAELNELMSKKAAIVRSDVGLREALVKILKLKVVVEADYRNHAISVDTCELRNLVTVAQMVVEDSMNKKVNQGTFYNVDLVGVAALPNK